MREPLLLDEAVARRDDADWARHALELIQNDQRRSADTHLLPHKVFHHEQQLRVSDPQSAFPAQASATRRDG